MTGIFDSGVGGLTALREYRRICPSADICYFADRKNAPYGNKSREELMRLVGRDIEIMKRHGAEKILVACCTASAVLADMKEGADGSVYEIITPTVREALSLTDGGRIGYISTAYTKGSFEFENRIYKIDHQLRVYGTVASEIVGMAERGECDENLSSESLRIIERILAPLLRQRVDTVILACTHFTYFEKTVGDILGAKTVSAAYAGARAVAHSCGKSSHGEGRTVYIDEGDL